MTQLNESIKLSDVKIFFPKCRSILNDYGLKDRDIETETLKRACEIYQIDLAEVLAKLARSDVETYLPKPPASSSAPSNKANH